MPSVQDRRRPRASTTVQGMPPAWGPPDRGRRRDDADRPGTARTTRRAADRPTTRRTQRGAGRRGEGSSAARRRGRRGRSRPNRAAQLSVWLAGGAIFSWICLVALVMGMLSGSVGAAGVLSLILVIVGIYAFPIGGLIFGIIGMQREPKWLAITGVVINGAILVIYQVL